MKNVTAKTSSIYLLLGILLMVATMVLHPVGGGFEELKEHSLLAVVSHSLAILSVPFTAMGFFGLSRALSQDAFFSWMAFSIMTTGLIAAMMAATLNGIAQPLFVQRYTDASPETLDLIRPIFHYNMALNHAFDYILIAAMFLSTLMWSVAIIRTGSLPKWTGYLGIGLAAVGCITIASGFYFLDLYGFRFFILGWVTWIVCVFFGLRKA